MTKGRMAVGFFLVALGAVALVGCEDEDTSGGGGGMDSNESAPDLGPSVT